jgi:hypothetical protein
MNLAASSSTAVHTLPETDAPVERADPALAPPGLPREVVEVVRLDCRLAPAEYLYELHVPGGGE